jgi:hypothetical protein
MFSKSVLKVILGVWVLWHLAFGILATFAPDTGARLTGWSPEGGWTTDMVSLSTQYGMVMLLLALVYAIMMVDPVRYVGLIWVAIAEQVLGIGYAAYVYTSIGNVTLPQVAVQSGINLVIVALFFGFWLRLRLHSSLAHA